MPKISAAPPFIMNNICRFALNTLSSDSFDIIIKINQLLFPKVYFILLDFPDLPESVTVLFKEYTLVICNNV